MTTIITKNGSGAPTAGQLSQGELAVDLTNKELYTKDSGGNVIKVGAQGGSTGTFTDLTATSSFTSPGIDDNANATAITIDANENVGIGDTSPSESLSVDGNITVESAIYRTTVGSGGIRFASSGSMRPVNTAGASTDLALDIGDPSFRFNDLHLGGDALIDGNVGYTGKLFSSNDTATLGGLQLYRNHSSGDCYLFDTTAAPYSGDMIFGTTNTERMRIDGSGNVGIGTDAPWSDAQLTVDNGGTGDASIVLSRSAEGQNDVALVNDGGEFIVKNGVASTVAGLTEAMRISSSGDVGIGTASPAEKINIVGAGGTAKIRFDGDSSNLQNNFIGITGYDDLIIASDEANSGAASTIQFRVDATERMRIDSSGYLINPTAYNATTGSAANMHVLSSGAFVRSVSSIKYKTGVEDARLDHAKKLYDLRPVYYKSLGEFDNPDWSYWGFIAEEVAEVDPRLAHFKTTETSFDENGERVETQLASPEVEGVQYDRMVPLLLMLMKEQKEQIETLQTEVAALKGA